jgi:hypothetical protein
MTTHLFKLRPTTPDHDIALKALNSRHGFEVKVGADGYHHVTVEAVSFEEAQFILRDALAALEPGAPLSVPTEPEPGSPDAPQGRGTAAASHRRDWPE